MQYSIKMNERRKPRPLLFQQLFLLFFNILPFLLLLQPAYCWVPPVDNVEVGVIMEMGTSWEGEMLQRTMSMAVSDFYALHSHFNTRLLLHFINSRGNQLQALPSGADDLLNKSPKLRGIILIGPRRSLELEYIAKLFAEKFGIPVISFYSRPQVKEGIAKCIIWDLASAAEKASRTAAESHSTYFGDLENFAAPIGEFSGLGNRVIYRPSRSRRRSLNEEANDENIVRNHSGSIREGKDSMPQSFNHVSLNHYDDPYIKKVNSSSYNVSQSGVIPKKLRVGVPLQAGFDELFKVQVGENSTIDVSGFCVDVFKSAIHLLPYEVSYEFVPFVNDPQPKPWIYNDLVYQVYLQKFDTAVADITITANRTNYVDFTLPYTDLGLGVLVRKQDDKSPWIFTKPLKAALWGTMAVFLVWTGFVVWVIERPSNAQFQGSIPQQIATALWFSLSTLFYAHRERLTSNLSRFVVVIWLFVVLIMNASYTATLTSMLTVQQINKLSSKETRYIGLEPGPLIQGVASMYNASDHRHNTTHAILVNHTMRAFEDALLRGSKHGGVSAIVDMLPFVKLFVAKHPKEFSMAGTVLPNANGFGFPFRKGSRLAGDMSAAIAKLREEGKLQLMQDAWFKSRQGDHDVLVEDEDDDSVKPLTLERFDGLFLISGSSSVLALFLFCMLKLRVFRSVFKKVVQCGSRRARDPAVLV